MSIANQLIDPRLMSVLGIFYSTPCRIESQSGASYGDTGQPISGAAAIVLDDLLCEIAPIKARVSETPGGTHGVSATTSSSTHNVAFPGLYEIKPEQRFIVPSGPHAGTYNIVRAGADGTGTQTLLEVEKINGGT